MWLHWTSKHAEIFVYFFLYNAVEFCGESCILSVSSTLGITTSKVESYKLYFTMSSLDNFQQHIVIKFFQKWGKLQKETIDALCVVYGDTIVIKSSLH